MKSNCIVCGSDSVSGHIDVTDWFLSKESFSIISCGNCGFMRTSGAPSEDKIGNYYKSEEYISHSDNRKGITHSLYHWVRSLMLRRKFRLVQKYSDCKKGKLLDIGCGTGYFPAFMKGNGWLAEGIEKDEDARNFAIDRFGLKVSSPGELISYHGTNTDVVTLWHVLEHIHDPANIMEDARKILRPGGACIVALPNCESIDARHFGPYWAAWDVPRHLWHFCMNTFCEFASGNGFEVVAIKRMPFDGFYVSILSSRYRSGGSGLLSGLLTGSWGWMTSLFRKSASSSLIYVLRSKEI